MKNLNALVIGLYLIFVLLSVLLLVPFTWFIGYGMCYITFPLAVLLASLILHISGFCFLHHYKEIILSLLIIALCAVLSAFVMDISFDGQVYHQPTVYALSHGWNPIRDSHNPIISDKWGENIWIDHYCRGMETISASIVAFTGNMESGKAVNIIIAISLFCIIYSFLTRKVNTPISRGYAILYAVLLTFSPTVVGQMFTYYIDLCGYYTFIVTGLSLYLIGYGNNKYAWFLLAACIILSGSTKYNMFFWTAYIIFIFIIYLFSIHRIRDGIRIGVFSMLLALVTILFVSYNPFITNTLDHSNPVYPLGGNDPNSPGLRVTASGQPAYMAEYPQPLQVLISLASRPQNDVNMPSYIHPYKHVLQSIPKSAGEGPCLGGAGFLFFECVILSLILLILCERREYTRRFLMFLILYTLTPFLLPLGSNIRYVPFIYALPIIILLYSHFAGIKKGFGFLRSILLIFVVVNIAITTSTTTIKQGIKQLTWVYYLDAIKGHPNEETYQTGNWSLQYKIIGCNESPRKVSNIENYSSNKLLSEPFSVFNREILDKDIEKRFLGRLITKQ